MLNKDILTTMVEILINSDAAKRNRLKVPVISVFKEYPRRVPRLNYKDIDFAKAYMMAYFPYYVVPVYQVLQSLPQNVSSAVFGQNEIEICVLGCGLAPEILGVVSYIDEYFSKLQKVNVSLHDVNIKNWNELIKLSFTQLSELCWKGNLGFNKVKCNLNNRCSNCFINNCRAYKESVDVYIVQNCLSDVTNRGNAIQANVLEIFKAAKPGAMFILIDTDLPDTRKIMNNLEKCIVSLGIGQVIKPVGKTTQYIEDYFNIPNILEPIFDKADCLIANSYDSFISSIFIKEKADVKFWEDENIIPRLFTMVKSQDIKSISRILRKYPFLANSVDTDGSFALCAAAKFSDINNNLVGLFISNGADLNAVDVTKTTALHQSVMSGNKDCVITLLEAGAYIDSTDKDELTSLMYAAIRGNINIVEILLDNGANYKLQDRLGLTALHYAAASGAFSIVNLLIDNGADKTIRDYKGKTPLHHAAESGQLSTANLLINIRTINSKDFNGRTPLHFAVIEGYTDMIKCLLIRGASSVAKDASNKSPYDYASRSGNKKAIILMSKANILNMAEDITWENPNSQNRY